MSHEKVDELLAEIGQKYPPCGFHVGDGWFPHVAEALRKISKVGLPWQLAQVKQKFQELRIYIDYEKTGGPPWRWEEGHPDYPLYTQIQAVVREAQYTCDRSCESCGSEVKPGQGVGTKLCGPCMEKEYP